MKLTAAKRRALPSSTFALPGGTRDNGGKPAFPTPDKPHAVAAKAYASKEVKTGDITPAQKATIDAKANRVLGKPSAKPMPKAAPKPAITRKAGRK